MAQPAKKQKPEFNPSELLGYMAANHMDRWLNIDEAAYVLGDSVDNLYRTWQELPFARRYGKKRIRFSMHGIQKYIANKLEENGNGRSS
jgi:hypothetical protein